MESNSSKSGSSTKVDGASSSKVVSTTAKGSTSLSSAKTDSNCSRSSAKEIGINKVASPSHSSSGKKTSIGGSDTNDRFVSCFGKVSSSFRYEKVMLVSPQGDHGSCSINKKQVAVHEDKTSDRTRRDARRYKEWLKSTISKRKMSETNGKRSVTSAEACKENKEEVIEGHLSCSKRQRVDFDSTQESYSCNAEPGNISPVQDEKELISELNADQAEAYFSDTLDKEFQLEKKIGRKQDTCVTCLLGGKLLCCVGKGCKRSFHLSCLVPALSNNPPGLWHCIWCVKKKKELGVHSVSEVESIWDARDVVSDDKALKHGKQYLVKYRGLAHVHNRWIPETKLLSEAPALVTKYNSKNQVTSWKKEWTVPHRLLQKRKLLFPTNSDENNIDCSYEWLVKWIGLGYEQATWELENSSFLMSPEAMNLTRDFEFRHQKSERLTSHSEEKEKERCSVSDLSQLSFGGSPGEYDRYQNYVNKLLAHWHKCQNAVVYDDQADQERVMKVILFVLSLQSTTRRPSLIISKSTALSIWESEFIRVASSANIIFYNGSKDVRSSIRSLEFYNESGSIMFEILLSSYNIVAEDLDILKGIEWGAIIVDECQSSHMSRYFGQIKKLIADMRLLLVSGQIKECDADYQNMLSLLDSGYELGSDNLKKIDSYTNDYKLKDIFSQYIAFECKLRSSSFVEYWVPVQLSHLQLEQYCATLLSNSMFLSSSSKSDPVDVLRDVIISTRKCCDHPYLLDQSLESVVTKGLSAEEKLDVEIKASGKLELLDNILKETKARDLRVLILFQSIGGSGRDSVGNILDDLICQRFGKQSYVRIDAGRYAKSKKKDFVNTFNNKESGISFLLLEDRACHPSIKLSAVDVVILFDSGLEPQNDIKALHRISIGSQFEEIKIFRLYSSFTVEEKILILAKEGTSVDSNIWTLNRNSCLRLLSWGASYLFNKLDEFHGFSKSVSVSNVSCEKSILNGVFLELLTQLPCSGESNHSAMRSFITKVPQNAVYDGNTSLFGEKEIGSMNNELSIFFWQKLLEGRDPQWKWLSDLSPRNRKKVNYLDNPPRKSDFGDGGVIMKSQIGVNSADDRYPKWTFKGKRKATVPNPKWKFKGKKKATVPNKIRKLAAPSRLISEKDLPCSTDGKKDVNQNNPLLLKLGISKLCEVLLLPENVKSIAVSFLEYIIQDYKVSCKSTSTSQAYQLSLCWTAADLLKHKVDKNESLAIAKLGLNLDCREEEVEDIYSELQSVAKEFAQCSENLEGYKKSNCSKKVCGDPRYTVQKNIPSSPNCSQSGTVHGASSKDPDESLVKKTVSSSSTRMVAGRFGSDTEHGGTGTDAIVSEEVRATCDNQQHKVSSSVVQPKYHALTSDSQELQSPLQSGTVHGASSKVPDEFLMEKTVSSSSTRKVAGHFGSGSEHGGTGTEAIGSEEVRATCNSEHGGTGTEAIGSEEARATCNSEHGGTGTEAIGSEEVRATCNSEHGGTGTEAIGLEEVRATCNSEHGGTGTEAIVSEEVRATCDNQQHKVSSSVVQPKHHALTSDSQELQSPIQPPATESATEPSEVPQVQCTAVVAGNDLMISTNATQPNEENDETDAVTSERETVSKMGHHDAAVTRLSGDSNSLEFPGTGHFLLEADINTVELNPLLCQETAVSSLLPARLSSAESNISAIPASGVQHDLSSNWHVLCQEAPVPRQASLEVLLDEPSNAPVRNSVTLLPQQPSSSTPMAESETCTENQRTTSTPLRLPNDLPCQVNTFGPVSVTTQPAESNPLRIELARLKNFWDKTSKQHEDMISRLKSERDKEVEEICKKYDMLVRDAEMTFTKRRQDYESYCNMVYSNNVLAETLTFIFDKKAVQFAGFDSFIHLAQQPTVMLDPRIEPSLTSLGAPPPLHMFNHSPSAVVAPHFAPTVCVAESNQVCNVRAPAPHLRALNSPSMSIPPTSALHGRMPNQQIANNPPAISPNLHASALLGRMPNQQLANNLPAISPDPHLSPLQGRMPNQQLANDLPAISPDPYLSALQGRMPNQQLANNLPAISPDPYLSALQGSMPNQQQLAHNLPTISQDPHLSALQGRMSNQQLAHTQLRISPILPQGTSRLLPTETLGLHPVVAGKPVYDRYIPALELLANIGNHVSPDLQHHLRPHQNFGLPSYLPNLTDQIATDSLIVPTAAINAEPICLSDDD